MEEDGAACALERVAAELDRLDAYLGERCRPGGWDAPAEMLDYVAARLDEIRKLIAG